MRMKNEVNVKEIGKQYDSFISILQKYLPNKYGAILKEDQFLLATHEYESMISNSAGIYGLVNYSDNRYVYVSDNYATLDVEIPKLLSEGLPYVNTFLHPDERSTFMTRLLPTVFRFFAQAQDEKQLKNMKAMFTSRMRMKNGEYRWFMHQVNVLSTDEHNSPLMGLKFMVEIEGFKKDYDLDLTISMKDPDGIYHPVHKESFRHEARESSLSKREIEILKLVAQGNTSKQIAYLLDLSEHTVIKHRKNMLKKRQVSSAAELVNSVLGEPTFQMHR